MKNETSLRDMAETDLSVFFENQFDSEAQKMTAFVPRGKDAFRDRWTKMLNDLAIIKKTIVHGGAVAGYVASFDRSGKREVCYWLGRTFWGKGIATRALSEFTASLAHRPLYARVLKRNAASMRVSEKCGFAVCGEDKFTNANGEEAEEFVLELK